jgi:DNA-binding winged helix-turn-helix (wHTH) protein
MRYRFADYLFDTERGLEGPRGPIDLGRRDAALLGLLLAADGRVVSKKDIADRVWHGRDVSDESIAQSFRRIRAALAASPAPKILRTIYGVGARIEVPIHPQIDAGSHASKRGSRRIDAEALLTSAREVSATRTPAGLALAVEATRRALEVDPDFVAAWCALAEFELIGLIRSVTEPRHAARRAAEAADRALSLDRECVPAMAIRGFIAATIEGDVATGRGDLERALRIDSGYWVVRGLHGWVLLVDGRPLDAVAEVHAALQLNPFASWFCGMHAQYLLFAGERDAAIAAARESIRRFPAVDYAYFASSQVASALDLHAEAIASGRKAVELAPETPLLHTPLACALARAGRRKEALALIREIERADFPLPATWLAPAWLALGERERALDMLALARDQGAPQYAYARYDPRMAPMLERVGTDGRILCTGHALRTR